MLISLVTLLGSLPGTRSLSLSRVRPTSVVRKFGALSKVVQRIVAGGGGQVASIPPCKQMIAAPTRIPIMVSGEEQEEKIDK